MYSHQGPQGRAFTKPTFPHGVEPLLATNRIHDMRARIDDIPLSPNARKAVEVGIARIEQHWERRKQEAYQASLAKRDDQHATVIQVAIDGREKAKKIRDQVEHGRMSPREARAWVRNVLGDHGQLVEMHEAVAKTESSLEAMEAMDVADYQAEYMDRFPSDRAATQSLGREVADYIHEMSINAMREDVTSGGVDRHMIRHPDGPQD